MEDMKAAINQIRVCADNNQAIAIYRICDMLETMIEEIQSNNKESLSNNHNECV